MNSNSSHGIVYAIKSAGEEEKLNLAVSVNGSLLGPVYTNRQPRCRVNVSYTVATVFLCYCPRTKYDGRLYFQFVSPQGEGRGGTPVLSQVLPGEGHPSQDRSIPLLPAKTGEHTLHSYPAADSYHPFPTPASPPPPRNDRVTPGHAVDGTRTFLFSMRPIWLVSSLS